MARKPQPAPFDGALVIDKPAGKTSHDVVEAVRRLLGFRHIGHLGTLDPLATGVLVLLLGRATRLAQFYAGRRKRYTTTVRFGFATDTYDADGTPLGPDTAPELRREELERLAAHFVGRFAQVPPAFSAKKVHGRPAHELARKKKPVELKPVEVEVYEFRLTGVDCSLAQFVIECAPGTYIRSLAHEVRGRALERVREACERREQDGGPARSGVHHPEHQVQVEIQEADVVADAVQRAPEPGRGAAQPSQLAVGRVEDVGDDEQHESDHVGPAVLVREQVPGHEPDHQ